MTAAVLTQLLALAAAVALGALAGRLKVLAGGDTARVLGNVAFMIFVPALLFRTAARIDFATLPWRTLAAYFVPAVLVLLGTHGVLRWRGGAEAAAPAVRAFGVTFGNSVQFGIPLAAALFGEVGLAIHITLVSLHALVVLSLATTLVELDVARGAGTSSLRSTLVGTVRNTVVHPVMLPVLAGLLWNVAGLGLPGPLDATLQLLASAVVPLCLVLIGLSLAQYGLAGQWRGALGLSAIKLLLLPAVVYVFARWVFGLDGTPLAVVVMMAALPAGSNALIFAQRYGTLEGEATAIIVVSTLAFVVTAPLWLALLGWLW